MVVAIATDDAEAEGLRVVGDGGGDGGYGEGGLDFEEGGGHFGVVSRLWCVGG